MLSSEKQIDLKITSKFTLSKWKAHNFMINKYNIILLLFLKINDSVFQYIQL